MSTVKYLSLLFWVLLVCGCDSSGWTNPPGDDDDTADDDDAADDDDIAGDDDDTAGDDDDTAGDDDDSAAADDDDSAVADDDDTGGDDDDSGPDPGDLDGDGYSAQSAGGDDCDDSNPAVNPGAIEDSGNGVDDDCDGTTDEDIDPTAFSPTDGLALGGTVVSLSGTGLSAVTAVSFGGQAATSVTVVSDTLVEAVAPAHAVGDAEIVVSSSGATVALSPVFKYTAECTDPGSCLDSAVLPSQVQISTQPGVASAPFTAVLSDSSISDCSSLPSGVIGELGLGQQSANPNPNVDPNWRWFPASFDGPASSSGDCAFSGTITHGSFGSFWVSFRFSDDDGYRWIYADSDATTALDYLEMSQLHVTP